LLLQLPSPLPEDHPPPPPMPDAKPKPAAYVAPLFPLQIIFLVFGPEIARQAPKRSIPFAFNEMHLA
jgi:hypothetical protein